MTGFLYNDNYVYFPEFDNCPDEDVTLDDYFDFMGEV